MANGWRVRKITLDLPGIHRLGFQKTQYLQRTCAECEMKKLARETIEALDRWSGRLEGHFNEKRNTRRSRCCRMIYVTVPEEFADYIRVGAEGMAEGVTRNISTTGVGFLLKQRLPADRLTICFHQDNGDWLKIEGKVVRHRKVHNGYWEYGVQFIRRADGK